MRKTFCSQMGFLWTALAVGALCRADEAEQPALLAPASGATWAGAAPIDALMQRVIREHQAIGVGVAVAKDGRIVYARGFGLANRETGATVQPTSLFRIASLSKPITAVATLRLFEQGKLSLDDRVFDVLGLDAWDADASRLDPRWKSTTIRHLLQHTGGWDRQVSFDPMFQSVLIAAALEKRPPATARDVIRFMLGQPLDFAPGERYAYSNFGYNLLGRVIEAKTGRPYAEHVLEDVLEPAGAGGMRIGASLESAEGEVHYYDGDGRTGLAIVGRPLGRRVEPPYGTWFHESLDAHGGWIASAVDLVRFACALQGGAAPLLNAESVAAMKARPEGAAGKPEGKEKPSYYGLGWMVHPGSDDRPGRITHNGSLPGTSTILQASDDGFAWSVLFNTRSDDKGRQLAPLIEPKMIEAIGRTTDWPLEAAIE